MTARGLQRVPILVYHHVYQDEVARQAGDSAGLIGITEFKRQLSHVRDSGWTIVSTSDLVNWMISGKPLPPTSCVIHFDNGWLDTYTIAWPILADLGMKATCFPITQGIDAASSNKRFQVRTQTEGCVENPFMTWSQLARLRDEGWELGAHTHTHCKMADKQTVEGDAGVLWEAEMANDRFQRELGWRPRHFAYPSGSRNARTDELLSPIYQSLRLWSWEYPIHWAFTDRDTSVAGIRCENIDARVPFSDFKRIFVEAQDALLS